MKKLVILGLCLFAASCHQKNSNEIKQDAMTEIKASVNKFNKAELCKKFVNNKQALDSDYEGMHQCSEVFDTSQPIAITDFKVYNQQKEVACGFVSGTSMAGSNIGMQFVYVGGPINTVYLKPSLTEYSGKYIPMALSKSLEIFNNMYQDNCK